MDSDVATWSPKPWGGELPLRRTDRYVVKVLHLNAGCRTSLQYHRVKRETMHPGSGRVVLELHRDGCVGAESLTVPVEILPRTVHRLVALQDCEVVEMSTTELDDVVRVADDCGRASVLAVA